MDYILFPKLFHINGFSCNLTPRNTTSDTSKNKYICVRELIFRLSRDVSLRRLCSNSLIASATTTSRNLSPAAQGCKIVCKRVLFFDHGYSVPHLHVNRPKNSSSTTWRGRVFSGCVTVTELVRMLSMRAKLVLVLVLVLGSEGL